MKFSIRRLLWCLVAIGALAGLVVAFGRVQAERAYTNVAIVMDADALSDLAAAQGWDLPTVLRRFKAAGLTHLAFDEITLQRLQTNGVIQLATGAALNQQRDEKNIGSPWVAAFPQTKKYAPIPPTHLFVSIASNQEPLADLLSHALQVALGRDRVTVHALSMQGYLNIEFPTVIEITADPVAFPTEGIGFLPDQLAAARAAGLGVILRPENKDGLTAKRVAEYWHSLQSLGPVSAVVFGGAKNEALGYPGYVEQTKIGLDALGAQLGVVEVSQVKLAQKGVLELAVKRPDQSVRVLSLPVQYQQKYNPDELNDIYDLGVRERNIRLVYLRPWTEGFNDQDILATNVSALSDLKTALAAGGFRPGEPGHLPAAESKSLRDKVLGVVVALGAWAAGFLFLGEMWALSPGWVVALVVVLGCATGALGGGPGTLLRNAAALAAALSLPTLALTSLFTAFNDPAPRAWAPAFGRGIALLLRASAVSLVGGLLVAGLLSSAGFMLEIQQFRGVKLLMVIPLAAVALLYLTKGAPNRRSLRDIVSDPVLLWQLAAVLLLVGAGVYYVLRTGNAPEAPASDLERSLRHALDQIMGARPRFKEFLIGHPALILASAWAALGRGRGMWFLLLLAAMGQADLVDSFCHLHTPLLVTFLRLANGLVGGIAFGGIALWLAQAWAGRRHHH